MNKKEFNSMKNKKIVALALAVLMMLSVFTATAYAKTTLAILTPTD